MSIEPLTVPHEELEVDFDSHLSVRFLGQFSAAVNGQPVECWHAGKARSFFQYLMLHRGQLITRDRLRDVLWPEAFWSASSSSLKVACHGARTAIGASRQVGSAAANIRLINRDGGYLLETDHCWCDIDEFRALARSGLRCHARGDSIRARADLEAAMALYRGDFLCAQDEDWVIEYREYYRSLAVEALDILRDAAAARGDASESIAISHRILQIDALHEPTYQNLIRVYGRLGQRAQALRWYQICAGRLGRMLSVEPSAQTRQALEQVRMSGRAGNVTAMAAAAQPRRTARSARASGPWPGSR